ncbi:hypothetical protein ACFLU6_13705, partial [Acidobacteriota bacterium]
PGADRVIRELEALLSMTVNGSTPEIIPTSAQTGDGVQELAESLRQAYTESGPAKRKDKRKKLAEKRLSDILAERFFSLVHQRLSGPGRFQDLVNQIAERAVDPFTAAETILSEVAPH